MIFGVVGDVHGDFQALREAMRRHPYAAFWLSVGDVAADDLRYPEPIAPLYWIQGNNEDFAFIARVVGEQHDEDCPNLHFLPNGTCTVIRGVTVAGLGGTFAPTWYDTPAAELPFPGGSRHWHPGAAAAPETPPVNQGDEAERGALRGSGVEHSGPHKRPSLAGPGGPATQEKTSVAGYGGPRHSRDDKRRHFVREQVDALKAAGGGVDVLLTHEAPRPFIVQAGPRRLDAGKTVINELLVAMRPRLHFFGHHHRSSDALRGAIRSIGLDLVSRSFVLVDGDSFEVTKV